MGSIPRHTPPVDHSLAPVLQLTLFTPPLLPALPDAWRNAAKRTLSFFLWTIPRTIITAFMMRGLPCQHCCAVARRSWRLVGDAPRDDACVFVPCRRFIPVDVTVRACLWPTPDRYWRATCFLRQAALDHLPSAAPSPQHTQPPGGTFTGARHCRTRTSRAYLPTRACHALRRVACIFARALPFAPVPSDRFTRGATFCGHRNHLLPTTATFCGVFNTKVGRDTLVLIFLLPLPWRCATRKTWRGSKGYRAERVGLALRDKPTRGGSQAGPFLLGHLSTRLDIPAPLRRAIPRLRASRHAHVLFPPPFNYPCLFRFNTSACSERRTGYRPTTPTPTRFKRGRPLVVALPTSSVATALSPSRPFLL